MFTAKKVRFVTGSVGILLIVVHLVGAAFGQEAPADFGSHIVGNTEVSAQLMAGSGEERVTGRVSFHLVASQRNLENGRVDIRGFNILFTGVPQRMLAGDLPVQEPLGSLSFAVVADEIQALRYDEAANELVGEVAM